jgi:hypothetical protein
MRWLAIVSAVAALVLVGTAHAAPTRATCDEASFTFTYKLYVAKPGGGGPIIDDVTKIIAAERIGEPTDFYGAMLAEDATSAYIALSAEHPCATRSKRFLAGILRMLKWDRVAGKALARGDFHAGTAAMVKASAALDAIRF